MERNGYSTSSATPATRFSSAAAPVARWVGLSLAATLLVAAHGTVSESAYAAAPTVRMGIPTNTYFNAFRYFNEGEYDEALRIFERELRSSTRIGTARWIDAICYNAMIGECYYHTGRYDLALEQYNAAVAVYVRYSTWLSQVKFTTPIMPRLRQASPWGDTARGGALGKYPDEYSIQIGKWDTSLEWTYGGAAIQARLIPIRADEIARCTALAIRRRVELLGPLCEFDAATQQLVQVLGSKPGLPNHWSQAWVDVQRGMALSAAGKPKEAVPLLTRGALAAGRFDHHLTPVALLELGRIALRSGDYPSAMEFGYEAAVAAYFYFDATIIEEGLQLAATAHRAGRQAGVYSPLEPAIAWANSQDYYAISAPLAEMLAAQHLAAGNVRPARALLQQAGAIMRSRVMSQGTPGAKLLYLQAYAAFLEGDLAEGNRVLAEALPGLRRTSMWLYHLSALNNMFANGQIGTRGPITLKGAVDLYAKLLRDPDAWDWNVQPMESLTYEATSRELSMRNWFLLALKREKVEDAWNVAELTRHRRFHWSLPLGGRVFALRTVLDMPVQWLPPEANMQRQDLLASYPDYAELSKRAAELRNVLRTGPKRPSTDEAQTAQREALDELSQISDEQETMLYEIAMSSEPVGYFFPPPRSLSQVREALPEGQVVLAFFATGGELYAILFGAEDSDMWRVNSPDASRRLCTEFLLAIGNYDSNRQLAYESLANEDWKAAGGRLLGSLLSGSRADFSEKFPALVVVPDSFVWYIPFEALHVPIGDGQSRPLIDRCMIRYAPTASLTVPWGPSLNPAVETVVQMGRLFPQDDMERAQTWWSLLNQSVSRLIPILPGSTPVDSSVWAVMLNRLVVLDDLAPAVDGAYAWSPMPSDRTGRGTNLGAWVRLPKGAPELMILPGFHTPAENGLRRGSGDLPGNELFLSSCALMAEGSRTLLLSRWRTGGRSAIDLVRRFLVFLEEKPPAEAWRDAVFYVAGRRLVPSLEPRLGAPPRTRRAPPAGAPADVQPVAGGEDDAPQAAEDAADAEDDQNGDAEGPKPPIANHPFFWAAYMLIDTGVPDPVEEEPADGHGDLPRLMGDPRAEDEDDGEGDDFSPGAMSGRDDSEVEPTEPEGLIKDLPEGDATEEGLTPKELFDRALEREEAEDAEDFAPAGEDESREPMDDAPPSDEADATDPAVDEPDDDADATAP